jgi:hypothetical protein
MSYKEEFYNIVGRLKIDNLKIFLKEENYTFDEFNKEYKNFKSEEDLYKKKLERLKEIINDNN